VDTTGADQDQVPPPDARLRGGVALSQLVETVGETILDVLVGPPGGDVEVFDAILFDLDSEHAAEPGDLALAVGLPADSEVAMRALAVLAEGQASAVCFRRTGSDTSGLVAEAERLGLALLAVPRAITWDRLYSLIRTVLVSAGQSGEAGRMGVAVGDLFALANALSSTLRCPVVIDDRHLQTLAYSADVEADELRRESILARRIPEQWLNRMTSEGVLRALHQSDEIVRFPPWLDLTPQAVHGRAGIAVRAGRDIIGYIWVEEVVPLSSIGEAALQESARIASVHILRIEVADEIDNAARSDLAKGLLEGRTVTVASLGIAANWRSTVLAIDASSRTDERISAATYRALLPLAQMHFAPRRHTYFAVMDHALYIIVAEPPVPAWRPNELIRFATGLAKHANEKHGISLRIGISSQGNITDAPRLQSQAEQVVALLKCDGGDNVAAMDDVRNQVILSDVFRYILDHPPLLEGTCAPMLKSDAARAGTNLEALAAYLAARGNIADAARATRLPANTLRYRVQAAMKATGLELDDPDARLVAELQIRAWQSRQDTERQPKPKPSG